MSIFAYSLGKGASLGIMSVSLFQSPRVHLASVYGSSEFRIHKNRILFCPHKDGNTQALVFWSSTSVPPFCIADSVDVASAPFPAKTH